MNIVHWMIDRFCPYDSNPPAPTPPPTRPNTPDTQSNTNTEADLTADNSVNQWPNIPFGD